MNEIKYIYIEEKFTICTGLSDITDGIELTLKELVLNYDALNLLNFISIMCDTNKPEYTFKWYCYYLAAFVAEESEERVKYNLTNPTIQILCTGELLTNLKKCFKK